MKEVEEQPRSEETEIFLVTETRMRVARVISDIANPLFVALPLFLIIALSTAPDLLHGLIWWGVTVGGMSVVPALFILRGVRHGQYSDHHVSNRKQRLVPLSFGLGCMVIAFVLLLLLRAAPALITTATAVIAVLAVAIVITQKWKISLHMAGISGAITALVLVLGPIWLLFSPLTVLIGWARWQVRAHTPLQAFLGLVLSVCVTVATFWLFWQFGMR